MANQEPKPLDAAPLPLKELGVTLGADDVPLPVFEVAEPEVGVLENVVPKPDVGLLEPVTLWHKSANVRIEPKEY